MALMDGRNQSETVRLPLVGVPKGTPSMLAREYTTLGPHRHQGRSLGCLPSIAGSHHNLYDRGVRKVHQVVFRRPRAC